MEPDIYVAFAVCAFLLLLSSFLKPAIWQFITLIISSISYGFMLAEVIHLKMINPEILIFMVVLMGIIAFRGRKFSLRIMQ